MEFGNPIVGLEELIREAIRSKNFSSDPEEGVTGWRIARDGSATFYNITVGSDQYTIDENGNAVFASVSTDAVFLDGEPLQEKLNDKARGIYAMNELSGPSPGYSGTPVKFAEIILTDFDPTRMFALGLSNIRFDTQSGTNIDRVTVDIYVAINHPATTADILSITFQELFPASSGVARDVTMSTIVPFKFIGVTPGDEIHFAAYFESEDTSGNLRVETPTNVSSIYIEDKGPDIQVGLYDMSTGTGGEQQYVTTWTATGSDSFQSDGTDRNVPQCYQGEFSSTNGNQFSMIQFDDADIRTQLSGSVIDKVEVYLNNNHSYFNGGITAVIGTHNRDVIAGNQSPSGLDMDRERADYSKGQAKYVTVPDNIGEDFRDGNARGIVLGQGPSNSNTYYGYFAGFSQSGPPKIRITYTK